MAGSGGGFLRGGRSLGSRAGRHVPGNRTGSQGTGASWVRASCLPLRGESREAVACAERSPASGRPTSWTSPACPAPHPPASFLWNPDGSKVHRGADSPGQGPLGALALQTGGVGKRHWKQSSTRAAPAPARAPRLIQWDQSPHKTQHWDPPCPRGTCLGDAFI